MAQGTTTTQRRVAGSRAHGPLVWQRTGTIGTELVLRDGAAPGVVTGSSVIGGNLPYAARWHADLDGAWRVRTLTVTTEGSGWRRNLALSRSGDGTWTCGSEESGNLVGLAAGLPDASALDAAAVLMLADSPIFLTWALRSLRLAPGGAPVATPAVRVRMPWLAVVPGSAALHRVSEHRLRVSGDGPAATFDLDGEGIVTYQPGKLRISQ